MSPWESDILFCLVDETRVLWCRVPARAAPSVIRGAFARNGSRMPNQGDDMVFPMGLALMEHVRFARTSSAYACGWRAREGERVTGVFVFLPMGEYLGGHTTLQRWVDSINGDPVDTVAGVFLHDMENVDESAAGHLMGLFESGDDESDLECLVGEAGAESGEAGSSGSI